MPQLCLDHLSLSDLSALDLIEVAVALDCAAVSLFVRPLPLGPYRDLVTDLPARREVIAALKMHGLGVGIVEPYLIDDAPDWDMIARTIALTAELGGDANALAFDREPARLCESMGRLAGLAHDSGVTLVLEAFSQSVVRRQSEALALAETSGDDVCLTVDTLHVHRTGGSWADVAALPPERIRHVQLSDGPLVAPDDLWQEATVGRLPPGKGEFDLCALVPLLPVRARIAVESPFQAPQHLSPLERGRVMVDATRALFADKLA